MAKQVQKGGFVQVHQETLKRTIAVLFLYPHIVI